MIYNGQKLPERRREVPLEIDVVYRYINYYITSYMIIIIMIIII